MLVLPLLAVLQQQPAAPPQGVPAATGDTSPFRPLALPSPNLIREGSGAPGPRYWQQRADYTIAATLDTATHTLTGRETIHYTNHSPDTLRYVWLQLDQNIYADNSGASYLFPDNARWAAEGFEGGYTIQSVAQGAAAPARGRAAAAPTPVVHEVHGTLMRVELARPLAPEAATDLVLAYSFRVPEHGSDRMGRKQYRSGWLYEMAQWYPRMAVYDDVHGWNTDPYLGQGEFYLEYGDIDFTLTVPRNYVVVASGRLLNPDAVLTATERERLARAAHADTTMAIISKAEANSPATRPAGAAPTLTWHFRADNVRDVAWAAAPGFIWDASAWDGILMQSFYSPEANPDWSNSTAYVRYTIRHYSTKWFHYPYATAINVAGTVGGMEYPMIVFCSDRSGRRGLYDVTTHELGHQWFPMVVGSNERRYTWMDEGFNTFLNIYSELSYFHDTAFDAVTRSAEARFGRYALSGRVVPIMVPPDRIDERDWGLAGYDKPALGLYLLRQYVLDDTTRFDEAFREYIHRWAFKHPTPADFFRTMDDALGLDLSWFWRGWFYTNDVVDIAVDSVGVTTDSAGAKTTHVYLSSPGQMPLPVALRLTFADGKTEDLKLPVVIWYLGNHYDFARQWPSDVVKVQVDPQMETPDVRRGNNSWSR